MVRIGSVAVGLVLASGAIGCKGDLAPQGQGTAGSGGTGGGGAGGAGTGGTTGTGLGPCDLDLSGRWDVIATNPASPSGTMVWVMDIGPNTFSFSNGSRSLVYTYSEGLRQLTWNGPRTVPINVSVAPGALDAGSLPLALGGAWTLSANGETCSVSVTSTEVLASCQGPGPYVGSSNWPYPLPSPRHDRQYSARRSAGVPLPSQLGDLSGQWTLTNGSTGSCSANIVGNTITATCENAQPLTGSLQLTLNGTDCVASGSSGRYELSARRR